jgi:uncharacterized protein
MYRCKIHNTKSIFVTKYFVLFFVSIVVVTSMYAAPADVFNTLIAGTTQEIQSAIDQGLDVHEKMGGFSPLMLAARHNKNAGIIGALMKAGADVNEKTIDGSTSLTLAAQFNKNSAVVISLLRGGAAVNDKTIKVQTALMLAVQYNQNPDVINALIDAGADVKIGDATGMTPLMYAAAFGNTPDLITALLKAGADIEAKDGLTDETPLMFAIQYNKRNPAMMTALIIAGSDVNAHTKRGLTPLIIAIWFHQTPAVITELLKAGAHVREKDDNGRTALDWARNNEELKGSDAYRQLLEASQ